MAMGKRGLLSNAGTGKKDQRKATSQMAGSSETFLYCHIEVLSIRKWIGIGILVSYRV